MKRLLPLILALCMLPVFSAVPVTAADNFNATFSAPNAVYTGSTFSLDFYFSDLPASGLCGIDLEVSFDKELVSFVSARISGFPAEGNWCGTGRVEDDKYLFFIFDDYEGGSAPVSVYDGSPLVVTLAFKANPGAEGDAVFSISKYGSVSGTVFDENGGTYVYGLGCSDKTVRIMKKAFPDSSGDGWYVKGGVMYVRPGITAEELSDLGVLTERDGTVKTGTTPAFGGDRFVHPLYSTVAVAIAMDVNLDGRVTTADYLLIKMHIKSVATLDGVSYDAADVDGDGVLTSTDAALFKQVLQGKRYPF